MKPKCKVCRREMQLQPIQMGNIPFDIDMVLMDWGLSPEAVDYYLCPERHTQRWVLNVNGLGVKRLVVDRKFDEFVDKPF